MAIFIVRRLSTIDRQHYRGLGRPRLIFPLLTSRQDVPSLYPMTEFAWLGREFVICLNMTNDVETTTIDVTPHISTLLLEVGLKASSCSSISPLIMNMSFYFALAQRRGILMNVHSNDLCQCRSNMSTEFKYSMLPFLCEHQVLRSPRSLSLGRTRSC